MYNFIIERLYIFSIIVCKSIILSIQAFKYFFSFDNFFKKLNSRVLADDLFLTLGYRLYYYKFLLLYIFHCYRFKILLYFHLPTLFS